MNRRLLIIAIIGITAMSCGCGPKMLDRESFKGGIDSRVVDDKEMFWISVKNVSNRDLDDVNINVTFRYMVLVDEKTFSTQERTLSVQEHWEQWKKGESKTVMAPIPEKDGNFWEYRAACEGTAKDVKFKFGVRVRDAEEDEFEKRRAAKKLKT